MSTCTVCRMIDLILPLVRILLACCCRMRVLRLLCWTLVDRLGPRTRFSRGRFSGLIRARLVTSDVLDSIIFDSSRDVAVSYTRFERGRHCVSLVVCVLFVSPNSLLRLG